MHGSPKQNPDQAVFFVNCNNISLLLDRKILSLYTDGSMQEKEVFLRIRKDRTKFLTTYMPTTGKINVFSRAMGLASIAQGNSMEANAKMRRHCKETSAGCLECLALGRFRSVCGVVYKSSFPPHPPP